MKKLMIVYAVNLLIVFPLQSAEKKPTLVTIDKQFIEAYKARRKAHKISKKPQIETTQKKPVDLTAYLQQLQEQIDRNNQFLEQLKIRSSELLEEEFIAMLSGVGIKELPTIIQDNELLKEDIERLTQENIRLNDSKVLVTRVLSKSKNVA
jgi:hypothetical protein